MTSTATAARRPRALAALARLLCLGPLVGAVAAQSGCASPADARDTGGDPLAARFVEGRFLNPPGSPASTVGWGDGLALFWWFAFGADKTELAPPTPDSHALNGAQALAQLQQHVNTGAADSITWLGHASFLVRIGGRTLLTDPFLSERASPLSGAGPRRFAGPGLAIEDLPPIDAVVISHNH